MPDTNKEGRMKALVEWLIARPQAVTTRLGWLGPLAARIVVGEVFLVAGWGKLANLAEMTERFASWGIPLAALMTPLVSTLEFVGGLLLLLGLCTRLAAAPLIGVMVVAIAVVLWPDVDSLDTLLGLSETAYLAIFVWLTVAGPGTASLDHLLQRGRNGRA
jgi:putative oxidoreductase